MNVDKMVSRFFKIIIEIFISTYNDMYICIRVCIYAVLFGFKIVIGRQSDGRDKNLCF